MEVHHSHSSHGKKKVKEYLLEFFMLFFAVTLGFFAENIREHYIERHREVRFLENIQQDIVKDINEIDKVTDVTTRKRALVDSFIRAYATGKVPENLSHFYYYARNCGLRSLFERSENGFIQLKNAGGLRMIEDNDVVKVLQNYEKQVTMIQTLQDNLELSLQSYRLKASSILNVITSEEMNSTQDLTSSAASSMYKHKRFEPPVNPLPLLTSNPRDINEMLNLLAYSMNTGNYVLMNLQTLRKTGEQLNDLIEKHVHH